MMTGIDPIDLSTAINLASGLVQEHPQLVNKGLQLVNGCSLVGLHFPSFTPDLPVLIAPVNLDLVALRDLLGQTYPPDLQVYTFSRDIVPEGRWAPTTLDNIRGVEEIDAIFIPASTVGVSLEGFMEVIAHLRAADGCPWDRKQTHATLRPYLLEETYEALEALDRDDPEGLREELGDILLQIALHAQIAYESRAFSISDILEGISKKIVSRHPHVFGDISVENEKEVIQNWEKIKEIERGSNGKTSNGGLLEGIPATLPALAQAQSIQERAARVGFDWPEISPVLEKVMEELDEVANAPDETRRTLELGDLLFAVVNLVRWYKVDAETVLRLTNSKFRKRFAYIEQKARSLGKEMQKMTLAEMDVLWEEAKKTE